MPKKDPSEILMQIQSFGVNLPAREIYLHSYYGSEMEPGVEYRSSTTFVKNIHLLDNLSHANILIHMQIEGGEWNPGMAIFDAIQACQSPVTILAYAQASSMSGIILQAAKKRVMMPNCEFLMHYGSLSVDSHSIAARSLVVWNDTIHAKMLRIFSERAMVAPLFAGCDNAEIERQFDVQLKDKLDWFLSASEAVRYGLADGVFGEKGFKNTKEIRR